MKLLVKIYWLVVVVLWLFMNITTAKDIRYTSLLKDCSTYNNNIRQSLSLSKNISAKLKEYLNYYESQELNYKNNWSNKNTYYRDMLKMNLFDYSQKYDCDYYLKLLKDDYIKSKSSVVDFISKIPMIVGLTIKWVTKAESKAFEYRAERIYDFMYKWNNKLVWQIRVLQNISQEIDSDNNKLKKQINDDINMEYSK